MQKNKILSIILSSLLFTVGCSSATNNDEPMDNTPEVSAPNEESTNLIKSDIENELSKINHDVKLSVSVDSNRKIKLILNNNSPQVINYGYTLYLEKKIDDAWYRLIEKVAYADADFELQPTNEFEQMAELDNWPEASSGLFRAYKEYYTDATRPASETLEFSVSNEFEIKK